MKVLVFAAGLGTRLKPLTDTLPKALVPIGGVTMLEHLIRKLKAAGFDEIVINVHHFADKIRSFVEENDYFGVNIRFSDETDLLRETGGGIRHAARLLNDGEPFLVHNVDIISNLDLMDFYRSQYSIVSQSGGADSMPLATLLVSSRETERYLLFDTDNNLCAWVNMSSGEFKSPFVELKQDYLEYIEKAEGTGAPDLFKRDHIEEFLKGNSLSKYAFAGIHTISPAVFQLMQDWPEKFSIIDFYLSVAAKKSIRAYVSDDLRLIDVGRIENLCEAADFLQLNAKTTL
jgi:N-acetyl-alpha-D-muramate 1-phosphate uridylyltransferase